MQKYYEYHFQQFRIYYFSLVKFLQFQIFTVHVHCYGINFNITNTIVLNSKMLIIISINFQKNVLGGWREIFNFFYIQQTFLFFQYLFLTLLWNIKTCIWTYSSVMGKQREQMEMNQMPLAEIIVTSSNRINSSSEKCPCK